MAMMTQVNDIDHDRHITGQLLEFIEAFCRSADIASIAPQPQGEDEPPMSMEERKKQPLRVKIENALPLVMRNSAKKNFVEKQFKMPTKDPEVGLYVLPNGKYF